MQISDLADIARCSANAPLGDDCSMQYLLTCLEDLRVVINRRKFNALTVETFGTRIEKLIRSVALQDKFDFQSNMHFTTCVGIRLSTFYIGSLHAKFL